MRLSSKNAWLRRRPEPCCSWRLLQWFNYSASVSQDMPDALRCMLPVTTNHAAVSIHITKPAIDPAHLCFERKPTLE
jgi:hypothetical protein